MNLLNNKSLFGKNEKMILSILAGLGILSITIIIIFGFLDSRSPQSECRNYIKRKNESFSGRVERLFIRRTNQMTVVNSKGQSKDYIIWPVNRDKLIIGDSVFKKSGDFYLTAIRNDSSFTLPYEFINEECEKKIKKYQLKNK